MSKAAVTGLGIICCLGRGKETVWSRLSAGIADFAPVNLPGFDIFTQNKAGQIPAHLLFPATGPVPSKISRHELLGLLAVQEAVADSGCETWTSPVHRIGVASGIGAAGMLEAEEWVKRNLQPEKRSPLHKLFSYPASSLADLVAAQYNWQGPRFSIATACSSSAASLGLAADAINNNQIDAAVVIGSEALSLLTYGGFNSLRTIASDTCRPFDKHRKGLILGEGAGALILENINRAKQRGAHIYGRISGWSWTADAYHMTAPQPDGQGIAAAMRQALNQSALNPADIDYINMHGTGTRHNDLVETKAVKQVFQKRAYHLPLSSSKSMTGHCLGAAGAIESCICLMALQKNIAPPTANLETADEQCDLDYLPLAARPLPDIQIAMNNVLAFGGNNVCIIFSKI